MAIEAAHVQFKYSKMRKEEVEVSRIYDDDRFLLLDEDPDEWIECNPIDCLSVLTLELNLLNSTLEKIYSVSKLRNLRRLLLRHCDHLQELPANLGDLGRLTYLSLEYCGCIKSLPSSIGKLSNLTSLHLIFCHYLKELPASLGELSNLSLLEIQCSQIKWLPWSIADLSKLTVLLLPTNFSLQTLPGHLNDSVVICQNYNVRKIWAELKTEISLFSIPVVGAEAPQFLSTPGSPGYVTYEGDPRPWIHVKGLHSLVRILDLNLRHCWCKESISDFIVDLPMLTHLYISWGCLSHLAVKLTKITHLSLYECKFQCHIESCFDSLAKLSTLQSLELRECEYLPTHMDLPVSLTHLTLQAYLSQKPLPDSYVASIRKLSNLKSLALLGYSHVDLSLLNVNLVKLKLWDCSIKSVPAGLQQLEIIHSKHLCENFSDYDAELQLWLNNLVSLQTLSLTCRHIQFLPSIEGLLNLQQLHLKDCFNLRKFPPNMDKLVNLHSINVSGTRMKSLPHSTTSLQNLQLIILPKCFPFKSLSHNFMKKVTVIEDHTDDLYYEHEGYYDSRYDCSEDREFTSDSTEDDDEVVTVNSIPNATQMHEGSLCNCSGATNPNVNYSMCGLSEELGVPLAHDRSNEHALVNEPKKTQKKVITRECIEELMSQNMRLVDAAVQLGVFVLDQPNKGKYGLKTIFHYKGKQFPPNLEGRRIFQLSSLLHFPTLVALSLLLQLSIFDHHQVMEPESERGLSAQKSSKKSSEMTIDAKGMIIGAVVAVIASVLALLNEYKSRTRRPRIIRQPYINRDGLRTEIVNSVLYCGDTHCLGQIRMRPQAFFNLCNILTERGLLKENIRIGVKEQVMIFLFIIGHNVRFRVAGARFFRSIWTIHHYFHIVLKAILSLYIEFVKPQDTSLPFEIQNNPRFFPWFEDFIGAIDGTHVRASVPIEMQDRFRGRKGVTTQNVLGVVDYDLKFTYVLAGWEGSAHDSRVLGDALRRGFKVPEGKYYLVDAGYGDRKGFMPPYRGVRYHLKEYTNNPPENERELFNLRHSSLRMCVERAFGVFKKRFRVLDAEPYWPYVTQVDVVLACCVLHNYLRGVDPNDPITREVEVEMESTQDSITMTRTRREIREENKECVRKRNAIALAMWRAYKRPRTQ